MNYQGVTHTTPYGNYKSRHPHALTNIGTHNFPGPTREEDTILVDKYMLEAFNNYPFHRPMNVYEGFARSYYTTAGHAEQLYNYHHATRTLRPNEDPNYNRMITHCRSELSTVPLVRSLDFLTQLRDVRFESSSSAGIGIPGKKGDPGNLERAISQANATVHNFMTNPQSTIDNTTPDRGLTRTQLTFVSDKLKIRNVFGQAFQYILIEGVTAQPLIEALSALNGFYFCGLDPRIHVPRLIEEMIFNHLDMMSLDWSHFDADVEDYEIEDAFDLLEPLLIFPNEETKAAFHFAVTFFIHRKITGPDQTLWFKHAGIPSGSYFTSLIGSVINWMRINFLFIVATGSPPLRIKVQGTTLNSLTTR
jgi:hypothetical protein